MRTDSVQIASEIYDHGSAAARAMDEIQDVLSAMPQAHETISHFFTQGLYGRSCFTPAVKEEGKCVVGISRIHRTEHQFVISMGVVEIWDQQRNDWVFADAPFHGITLAGTRRMIKFHDHTICTSFHPNPKNLRNLKAIERMLYLNPEGPLAAPDP
jgi:hypothetical protein